MIYNLKSKSSLRLAIIVFCSLTVGVLGRLYLQARAQSAFRVDAVGKLTFTFNGLPPNAPVFDVDDLKPGDCYTRDVVAQNDGQSALPISVAANGIQNPDDLGSVLFLTITEGAATLYGGPPRTLNQFFADSTATVDGLYLSSLSPTHTTVYQFQVCMPKEAGNEWQKTKIVFDLNFGRNSTPTPTPTPSIPVPPECAPLQGKIDRVYHGTEGNDKIHGSIYNDLIYGYGGNDELDSSGGNDCVIGGDGNDILDPEDGSDIVVGGPGNDQIKGGSGDDVLYGNDGNDKITGGTGNDWLWGGPGNDTLNGDSGDDHVYGEAGNDTLKGESGTDFLDGGADTDNLNGGSGIDSCVNGETLSSC